MRLHELYPLYGDPIYKSGPAGAISKELRCRQRGLPPKMRITLGDIHFTRKYVEEEMRRRKIHRQNIYNQYHSKDEAQEAMQDEIENLKRELDQQRYIQKIERAKR